MDPLSDVLSLLKPRSYRCGGFDVGGELCVQFGRHDGIKCYALVSGECWLAVETIPDPVHLQAGDCFLLPRGLPFRLATDLRVPPINALTFFQRTQNGSIVTLTGGGNCFIAGGHFLLEGCQAGMLLAVLPPIVHIRAESDKAELRWSLERMRSEIREHRPGGDLVVQQLAYMLLVQALRLHLEEGLKGGVGWLFALANHQINGAITAMHQDPAHRWTLQQLAEHVGMSRSIFALKFKQLVGTSPMEYLTHWRMMLAGDRLKNTDNPVSGIALSLGYESESAFGKAFKRVMGHSPRQHGRASKAPSAPRAPEQDALTVQPELIAG
jgi:AraC-like DNA-binding protein